MNSDAVSSRLRQYWHQRHTIPGLFEDIDFLFFDQILSGQGAHQVDGDLLEIGAFHGKSAIVIGLHADRGSRFFVCDVFGDATDSVENREENRESYGDVDRAAFEANYGRYVENRPVVIQALSSELPSHIEPGTVRFAHVDGGHLYEQVLEDAENVRTFMAPGGVVVFDDYRAHHTPGVAAAVWQEVALNGLVPAVLTDAKFYGTYDRDSAAVVQDRIASWLTTHPEVRAGRQQIAGHEVLVVANPRIWTARRLVRHVLPPVVAERIRPIPEAHLGA